MKLSLVLLLFLVGLTAARPVHAQNAALRDAVSNFEPSVSFALDSAGARVADFNGDGLADVATILVAPERRALVVFLGTRGNGYAAFPLYTVLPRGDVELRLAPPGRHRVLGPEGVIDHAASGIELVFPGRASALYVWRDDRFQVFGTENY